MALLQKVKDVYRALPPWVTAPVIGIAGLCR